MFVVYTGSDEIIVTTPEREPEMLKEYFEPSMGRNLEEYDRETEGSEAAITFTSQIKREW